MKARCLKNTIQVFGELANVQERCRGILQNPRLVPINPHVYTPPVIVAPHIHTVQYNVITAEQTSTVAAQQ